MGGSQKKLKFLRAGLVCLTLVFAVLAFNVSSFLIQTQFNLSEQKEEQNIQNTLHVKMEDPKTSDRYYEWGRELSSGGFEDQGYGDVLTINSAGEFAYFNKVVSENLRDLSGMTIRLNKDISMAGYANSLNLDFNPWWAPIEMGKDGKNKNIIFDGNGKTISGIKIQVVNDVSDPTKTMNEVNAGIFANICGGAVMNLTIDSPILQYEYTGRSENAKVLEKPVRISLGALAGTADGTYISNVTIKNPIVSLNTNNANGHNFYVGGAVGRLEYHTDTVSYHLDDENEKNIETEENREKAWGINKVTILDDGAVIGSGVNLTVTGNTYNGTATFGYVGGVVGANFSSKVINSTVKNVSITPTMSGVAGNYYAGGLAGISTLRIFDSDEVVVSGLMNNYLDATNVVTADAGNTGVFVGFVYGNWIYNNVGTNITVPSGRRLFGPNMWNQIFGLASIKHCLMNYDYEMLISHSYFAIPDEYNHDDDTACSRSQLTAFGGGVAVYCGTHGELDSDIFSYVQADKDDPDQTGSSLRKEETYANRYNKVYSTAEEFYSSEFWSKINDINETTKNGNMYAIAREIVRYEYGNQLVDDQGESNIRAGANQFCKWQYDTTSKKVSFDKNFGYKYNVTYYANAEEAGWVKTGVWGETYLTPEAQKGYRVSDLITEPTRPTRYGYDFENWYLTQDCAGDPYVFDDTKIMNGTEFKLYAKWTVHNWRLKFNLLEGVPAVFAKSGDLYEAFNGEMSVNYGESVMSGPSKHALRNEDIMKNLDLILSKTTNESIINSTDPRDELMKQFYGKTFADEWYYLVTPEKIGEEEPEPYMVIWSFGASGTTMLDQDVELFALWEDAYAILRNLLNSFDVNNVKADKEFYLPEKYMIFEGACNDAEEVWKSQTESDIQKYVDRVNDAIVDLRVNPQKMWEIPALAEKNSDQNLYPFLWIQETYQPYKDMLVVVNNYLNIELQNDAVAANMAKFKNYRSELIRLYNGLKPNTHLGVNQASISAVKTMYVQIQQTIDTYDQAIYEEDSWAEFESASAKFKNAFNTNALEDPYIEDLLQAIEEYQTAEKGLKKIKTASAKEENSNLVPQMPMPPILLGILVVSVLVLCVGGYIGFDVFRHKRLKAKHDQTVKSVQEASEDSYL